MRNKLSIIFVFTLFVFSLSSMAQNESNKEKSHVINYMVDGVENNEQSIKLMNEFKSRKGIFSAEFDLKQKKLTVKASIEIEEKHLLNTIISAGFKPMKKID